MPRAKVLAIFVATLFPESAVSVYTLDSVSEPTLWIPRVTLGEARIHEQSIPVDSGLLGRLRQRPSISLRSGTHIKREDFPHVDIRRTLRSICHIPLAKDEAVIGALEILSFEKELSRDAVEVLQPAAAVAAVALASAQAYEEERHGTLTSITRLTQLYDLEKVFSSTLEMEELLPLIGSKYSEILQAEAVNIWLLHPDETLELMHQAGDDPTTFKGQVLQPNEGVVGKVSENGESLFIADSEDSRLIARNSEMDEPFVRSLLAAPIMDQNALVGVVEVVNKLDGESFDEDDLFVLTSINDTASTALHNASLMLAERKVEILETLNTVSNEITSTLNLERMLQTIVNAPQAIIPYERAAIMLEQRGRFILSAITGLSQVNADAPEVAPLHEILQWACLSNEVIHVRQHDEEIDADREETRAKFRKYFASSRMRGFFAKPLGDDTGRVGLLAMESSDPDFLGPTHMEILELLSSQATVALRNAQLYKEVPFISLLEPVLVRKRKFLAMDKLRRRAILGLVVAAALFLVFCPWPMRVDGDALVTPLTRVQVQPEFEGVVAKVFVHEGEAVTHGQVLADMEAWNFRSSLAASEARYQTALLQMNRALMSGDASEAGLRRVDADYWKAEVDRARELLGKAQLRAPIDGIVATPHVENLAGRRLQFGESFAEIVDTSSAVVDVAIDDSEAGLLKTGSKVVVKLNSFPLRTFRGNVVVVSPKGQLDGESRVFFARVLVSNPDAAIRTGMQGRGKVSVGWHPAGYVLFRKSALWLYSRIWAWFGW